MHFSLSFIALAALVAPVLAAKTVDVNFVNGTWSPKEVDVAPGDTVRWPMNDGASHAIVETVAGPRACVAKVGGFNSGTKTKGQSYQRIFPTATIVNYKDGVGANCQNGASGTIFVHDGARPTTTWTNPTMTSASASASGSHSASASTTQTTSAGQITASPTPTTPPNGANGLSTPEKSVLVGLAAFIGALVL